MSEGWGAGKGKENLPLPNFSFSLPHLVNFLPRPNSPLYQDGGLNSRWKYISTRPTKIRLHCRLENLFFSCFVNLYFSVLGKLVFHLFVNREICINLLVFFEPTTFRGIYFYFFGDFSVIKACKTARCKPAYSTRSRMDD